MWNQVAINYNRLILLFQDQFTSTNPTKYPTSKNWNTKNAFKNFYINFVRIVSPAPISDIVSSHGSVDALFASSTSSGPGVPTCQWWPDDLLAFLTFMCRHNLMVSGCCLPTEWLQVFGFMWSEELLLTETFIQAFAVGFTLVVDVN